MHNMQNGYEKIRSFCKAEHFDDITYSYIKLESNFNAFFDLGDFVCFSNLCTHNNFH